MQKLFFLFCLLNLAVHLNAQVITTIAGTGTRGYVGDGGLATNAQLTDMLFNYPAFDSDGNLYIGQSDAHTIRKIDKSGIITTIAGVPNTFGYSGDNGLARNAVLNRPYAIAIDKSNNIYFADQVSAIIRKIDPNGIITSISSLPYKACENLDGKHVSTVRFGSISGLEFDQYDNLYVSDNGCSVVYKISPSGISSIIAGSFSYGFSGDGGPATAARLAAPGKVAIDANGNVYIPDTQNHRIRKVSTNGIITTIAGTGVRASNGDGIPAIAADFEFPGAVVIDKAGNLYVGDYYRFIRKIDPSGIVTTFAGNGVMGYTGDGGPATAASILVSQGRISIDANDAVYFCDEANAVIRKISNCLSSSYRKQPLNDTLCQSGVAIFSVDVLNASSLQWQENKGQGWVNIFDNAIYTGALTASLSVSAANSTFNGFQYRCVATNSCADVYSQPVKLIVNNPSVPQVTISSANTAVCTGNSVLFTATAVNAGTSPVYQWKKNGINVGTNLSTYSDNDFANGDIVICELTSSNSCSVAGLVTSNAITVTVYPLLVPSVSITSSENNICFGTSVTFNAVAVNGGTNPVYQWRKNGISAGGSSAVFIDNTLRDGDVITCTLISDENCKTNASATSNSILMRVNPLLVPAISITASAMNICPSKPVVFAASSVNVGGMPVYQWRKNGVNVGSNSAVYTDSALFNGDRITCTLLSNEDCLSITTVTSNVVSVNVLHIPVVKLDQSPSICTGSSKLLDAGSFTSYLWNDGSTARTFTVNQPGVYAVTVKDNNGCFGRDTTRITTLLPLPAQFLPADTSICTYDQLTLKPTQGFRSYLWSNNSTNNTLTIAAPGLYWLTVTDQNNCGGQDSVLVSPKECLTGIYVPNAFTPNNDQLNDVVYPIIGGNVIQYRFSIFNRWGKLVFTTTERGKGWNGTDAGYPQDPGLFTWTCTYQLEGGQPQTAKGFVILMR